MERKNQSERYGIRIVGFLVLFLVASLPACRKDSVDEISMESLAELPSKHPIVVVNFWATWCPPCLVEIPYLNRLHKQRPDIHIYGISTDDPALGREVFKVVQRYKMRYPVYMKERSKKEESSSEWYKTVDMIPVTYIFKDGKLHNTILGGIEKAEELTEAIDGPSEEELYAQEESGASEDGSDEEE